MNMFYHMYDKYVVGIILVLVAATSVSQGFQFKPGLLKVSSVNPRYVVDSQDTTKVVWLSGNHFWCNTQDQSRSYPPTAWDFSRDLDTMSRNKMNFDRLWTWEQSNGQVEGTDPWYYKPEMFLRTGPGNSGDGMLKFNLDIVNPDFISRVQMRLDSLKNRGMYASVMLFDGWSIPRTGFTYNTWQYHPFNSNNNINGIAPSSANIVHYAPSNGGSTAVWNKWYHYMTTMVDSLNSRDNFIWELGCEIADMSGNNRHYTFLKLVLDSLRAYESRKPKHHLIVYTGDWTIDNNIMFNSTADIVTPGAGMNGTAYGNGDEATVDPPASDGTKVILEDTDHTWGMLNISAVWYVWECFTRGHGGVILQDNRAGTYGDAPWISDNVNWPPFKRALGVATILAREANLLYMTPSDICSTSNYEIAGKAAGHKGEAIIWQTSGTINVNLAGYDSVDVKWIDPDDIVGGSYVSAMGTRTAGGAVRSFSAPNSRYDILYLKEKSDTVIASSPTLHLSTANLSFSNVTINTTSSEQMYTLTGSDLTPASGTITVTPPNGYSISLSSGSGFASSLNVPYSGGIVSTQIYVHFSPLLVKSYNGNITHVGGGTSINLGVTGAGVAPVSPVLYLSTSGLTFGNVTINTTSTTKMYTLSGSHLSPSSGNIVVTPPNGYKVSVSSGSGFVSTLNVPYSDSVSTSIYVRFSPSLVQSYNGNITHVGGGASINLGVTGAGVDSVLPVLHLSTPSMSFGNVTINTTSNTKIYTLTGTHLSPSSGNVVVTPPTGYTISLTNDSGFVSTLNVPYSGDSLSSSIYVRFSPLLVQSYNGNITHVGGGTSIKLGVTGTGAAVVSPSLHLSTSNLSFGDITINTTSDEQMYRLTGSNLTPSSGNIIVTPPVGYKVSLTSGSGFASALNVPYSGDSVSSSIYVRFSPLLVQSYSGNITHEGGGVSTTVSVSGTGAAIDTVHIAVYDTIRANNRDGFSDQSTEALSAIGEDTTLWISRYGNNTGTKRMGLEFRLNIPQYAVIDLFTITLTQSDNVWSEYSSSDTTEVLVYTDIAQVFSASHNHSLDKHQAVSATTERWVIPDNGINGISTSPNLSSLLQIVVNGSNWSNNKYAGFVLQPSASWINNGGIGFYDYHASSGSKKYLYARCKAIYHIDYTNSVHDGLQHNAMPEAFQLYQNYPNPFNPNTTIAFTLFEDSWVTLTVYDLLGREEAVLVNGYLKAGELHRYEFDASNLASGIYVYRLQAGKNVAMKKLILMK